MAAIHAKTALLPEGWRDNVRLTLLDGQFGTVETDALPQPDDERCDVVLPAMPNVHSHAFQRGMAGLTEIRGKSRDSFWSWRDVMYRFALTMPPEHAEAVATHLYMEMLEAGFSRVGEFHYLHHAPDGRPYGDPAEMAGRIAGAAEQTGIRLTLLPVFYAHADFAGAAPTPWQRRFVNDLDSFERLYERSRSIVSPLPGSTLGIAPHSLRAVTPAELTALLPLAGTGPVHMHIGEQLAEVKACIAWSGARPVEWLLEHVDVNPDWCLIHATHMTAGEARRLAASGAVVGLCPITEANLGDGIFGAPVFLGAGGDFGIGTDSNVLIGIADELRQLEYSQRLKHRLRNVLAGDGMSTGRRLFDSALRGGRKALQGMECGLQIGGMADFMSLDRGDALHLSGDTVLDGWIFANAARVDCVWTQGRKRVSYGRHVDRERISSRFQAAMRTMAHA